MDFIKTKGKDGKELKIAYDDYGTGSPVILIHGWPLCKEMWEYQVPALVNSGHRVIAYDRRGFGHSDAPWSGYDYDTLTEDLYAIITQLELHDVTLVGFSMGGGEVVRYFSKYGGEHISKAVLISSVTPFMLLTENNPEGVNHEVFEEMAEKIKSDRLQFLEDFGKVFFGVSMMNKPISKALLEYYGTLAAFASPSATLECAQSFSTTDFRAEMKAVNVPALIIHGSADKTVPIDPTGKESARMIPNSEFIIYNGAPHGLWYTHRERLNNDLLAFISGIGELSNAEESAYVNSASI